MKHDLRITIFLVILFLVSQLAGLGILAYNVETVIVTEPMTNESSIVVVYEETAAGPRPEVEGLGSLLYIAIAVALGTLLILGLIKLKMGGFIWKAWYFMAVTIAITIAAGVFIPALIALILAIVLAFLKLKYKNPIIHNITEVLMYSGIALLIVPLFTVLWAAALLVLISLYDIYAVWKSKHMIKLANFTTEQKLFPGLAIAYDTKKKVKSVKKVSVKKMAGKKVKRTRRLAILGGGDIIFPLIFTGAVLNALLGLGFEKLAAYGLSLIVTAATAVALYLLLYYAKKDKFYPAMPFVSAGCFTGFGLLFIVLLLF